MELPEPLWRISSMINQEMELPNGRTFTAVYKREKMSKKYSFDVGDYTVLCGDKYISNVTIEDIFVPVTFKKTGSISDASTRDLKAVIKRLKPKVEWVDFQSTLLKYKNTLNEADFKQEKKKYWKIMIHPQHLKICLMLWLIIFLKMLLG